MIDIVHPELNREVTAIGGHYVFTREVRRPFRKQEILYWVGYAVVDTSCCGVGGCAYAQVAGFVRDWRYKRNRHDRPVTRVEPITGTDLQADIRRLIMDREGVGQVNFYLNLAQTILKHSK